MAERWVLVADGEICGRVQAVAPVLALFESAGAKLQAQGGEGEARQSRGLRPARVDQFVETLEAGR